jgi:hypothetical protein
MRKLLKILLVGLAVAATILTTTAPAEAASYTTGNFGKLYVNGVHISENYYPNGDHACDGGYGWYRPVPTLHPVWRGHTYTLRLCYSPYYGAYARLDNAIRNDPYCAAVLFRFAPQGSGAVNESVDSDVTYAYTKVGNNLDGRTAVASLECTNTAGAIPNTLVASTQEF